MSSLTVFAGTAGFTASTLLRTHASGRPSAVKSFSASDRGNSKIEKSRVSPAIEHTVAEFEIAVNDALLVDVRQTFSEFNHGR